MLDQRPHGKPLVYLDSAATSQKPQAVIDAVRTYYETANANVHRGVYALAEQATQQYESVRRDVADFLGAARPEEIVFTRGTTDAINLVAGSWGRQNLRPGDEVLITHMEHHSNIVPWQLICEQTGAVLRVCP
ncbi:MAG: aminotransferase class V-fold PLP-dependent enzyme, partial [Phycisphaerae bacterium]|nr:aminotransferase class V-fold PLP-dependent enzyme [Phycisphaerae bacterium]